MHLNPEERSRLRTRLVKIRHEAQGRIMRQRSLLAEPGKNRAVGDGTEDTQNEMLTGTTIDLTVQATRILTQVDDALRAVSRDQYGVCTRCSGPITVTRLEALPFATLCIVCAQDDDAETQRRRHVPVYAQQ